MSGKCDGCELDLAHEKCMAEVSSLTAERDALKEMVKALEEQVKGLTFHLDQLIPSTPCPRCGHPALFVCSLGSLNCGCCGEHVGWDALARHEQEGEASDER